MPVGANNKLPPDRTLIFPAIALSAIFIDDLFAHQHHRRDVLSSRDNIIALSSSATTWISPRHVYFMNHSHWQTLRHEGRTDGEEQRSSGRSWFHFNWLIVGKWDKAGTYYSVSTGWHLLTVKLIIREFISRRQGRLPLLCNEITYNLLPPTTYNTCNWETAEDHYFVFHSPVKWLLVSSPWSSPVPHLLSSITRVIVITTSPQSLWLELSKHSNKWPLTGWWRLCDCRHVTWTYLRWWSATLKHVYLDGWRDLSSIKRRQ